MDLLASLQQLTVVQCTLATIIPQHGKQCFTEAEDNFNEALIFDSTLCFIKVMRALDMVTMADILELVEAAPSAAALISLKSAVLARYTTRTYWARERCSRISRLVGDDPQTYCGGSKRPPAAPTAP